MNPSLLPPGWAWTDTGSVTEVQGGIQKQPKRAPRTNKYPFLRVANVLRGYLDLSEVHEIELFEGELDRFRLCPGDLLVVEGNGSVDQIGRSAVWLGEIEDCVHQNHLIRVRPSPAVNPRFLNYYWNAPRTKNLLSSVASSTSGLYVLTTAKVRSVPIPLPPIEEQQRIVAAIEEQFSRLDAGLASMRHARNGADRLVQALVDHELASDRHHPTWQALTPHDLADEGRNSLTIGPFGSDLKVSDYTEHGVPLVFVRNIRSQSFAGNGTKYVSLEKAEALRSHRVVGGDVLITKMGDPPGDTAVYPHELPEAIITADCIKLTPKPSYDPHFIALALSTQSSRRQFAVITSGVAQQKVSLARFRHGIRLAVPPHAEQLEIVRRIDEARSTLAVTNRVIDQSEQRALSLRSSILSAAFTGKLVPQDSTDEPAFVLLERIAAERATSNGRKPSRSARRAPLL